MGQVPDSTASAVKILVIGDGRLATTLWSVLQKKVATSAANNPLLIEQWSRRVLASTSGSVTCDSVTGESTTESVTASLNQIITTFQPTHIWLAISDRALVAFATEHAELFAGRTVTHFSGSLGSFQDVHGAHPLTTFAADRTMTPDEFERIPFILDVDGPDLSLLLPHFKNPAYRLTPSQRAYYHALCVIAGNFTTLLWETVASRFETALGLPADALTSYREQIFRNLAEARHQSVLTGPLVRGDVTTMQAHERALRENFEMPLLKIYDGFADLYRTEST